MKCFDIKYETDYCRRYFFITNFVCKDKPNSNEKNVIDKPVLEVISPEKIGGSSKHSKVILENIQEKSLEKPTEQPKIISTESIKKLKDKIIGKSEKEEESKGKKYFKQI